MQKLIGKNGKNSKKVGVNDTSYLLDNVSVKNQKKKLFSSYLKYNHK